ncbi:hypothetical protein ANO11243_028190 [Dothideomycetidae sp. 11243]|nr:hypothetical protein ANO11243_028190 [fungal sp. No.11243]
MLLEAEAVERDLARRTAIITLRLTAAAAPRGELNMRHTGHKVCSAHSVSKVDISARILSPRPFSHWQPVALPGPMSAAVHRTCSARSPAAVIHHYLLDKVTEGKEGVGTGPGDQRITHRRQCARMQDTKLNHVMHEAQATDASITISAAIDATRGLVIKAFVDSAFRAQSGAHRHQSALQCFRRGPRSSRQTFKLPQPGGLSWRGGVGGVEASSLTSVQHPLMHGRWHHWHRIVEAPPDKEKLCAHGGALKTPSMKASHAVWRAASAANRYSFALGTR